MIQPKIGIVTVLYRSANVLNEFFECLNAQTYKNFVLYIIDNASPDDSVAICKRYTGNTWYDSEIIETGENGGIARGNNIGIEMALADDCDLVLLANNDIEFAPDTISTLVESMRRNGADMVVPKLYNFFNGNVQFAGGGFDCWTFPISVEGFECKDSEKFNNPHFIEFAPTCFMLFKREVFDTTGRMDERFFVYFDDTDFIWRAVRQNGFKLFYEPSARINHRQGNSSGSSMNRFCLEMDFRNMAYFMNKYFPWYKRWCIAGYKFARYFLLLVRHPSWFKFGNPIRYYRDGLGLFREWQKHGNLKK